MKKLWIVFGLLIYALQSYATDSNKVLLSYMKTDAGAVAIAEYTPIPAGNFVSPNVDKNDDIEVTFDTVSRKFDKEGKRDGLEIDFHVDRKGVSGDEGDYMIAAFFNRVQGAIVGGFDEITFNNVNFIFSGRLSINGSPVKGEIHFMQAEFTKQNQWYIGFNEGVYGGKSMDYSVLVCTEDGRQYHIKQTADDDDHQFRIYVTADKDKIKC